LNSLQLRYDSYRDDLFSQSTSSLSGSSSTLNNSNSNAQNQPRSNQPSATSNQTPTTQTTEPGKQQSSTTPPTNTNKSTSNFEFDEKLEYWENSGPSKFVKIASLHSELVALSKDGVLHQWKWKAKLPYQNGGFFHPKTLDLELVNEKVVGVSTSSMRASVWTESGKVYITIKDFQKVDIKF
jgi:hypothetical protein